MTRGSKLLAWVDPRTLGVLAVYIGGDATAQQPATKVCSSTDEAHAWVEAQAAALGLQVEWLSGGRRSMPQAQPVSIISDKGESEAPGGRLPRSGR